MNDNVDIRELGSLRVLDKEEVLVVAHHIVGMVTSPPITTLSHIPSILTLLSCVTDRDRPGLEKKCKKC